jgi:4-amino-4-deoxy-L-arabinose transferase-like glycosyltransferase
MSYAENYYAHYPKVALGHYPPAFYALEGGWLCAFPVTRASVLWLMAALAGSFGTMLFSTARQRAGPLPAAVGVAGLALALPLTQSLTSVVMADLLVAILVFLSALSLVRYMERERWIDSLAFGLLAAAAMMTKGSAVFLALLPPPAILLTGRYRLLAKGSLWLAVVPVLLICGPWLWLTAGISAEGMNERGWSEHLRSALPYFPRQFARVFGFTLLIPAAAGTVRVLRPRSPEREPFWAVMVAVPLCLVAFLCAVPAGLEARYLLPAVPSVLLLAASGAEWPLSLLERRRRSAAAWGIGFAVIGLFACETFTVPRKGFDADRALPRALADLAGQGDGTLNLLVSSDARGEGAIVSEVAMLDDRRPSHTVARSSKVLAESDWLGRGYREAFESDDQLRSFLAETRFDAILIDETIPEIFLRPHHTRLARVLQSDATYTRVVAKPANGIPVRRGGGTALYLRANCGP